MELPDSARGCCRQRNDVLRGEEPWNDNQSSAYFVTPMFHPLAHSRCRTPSGGTTSRTKISAGNVFLAEGLLLSFALRFAIASLTFYFSPRTFCRRLASSFRALLAFSREKFSHNDFSNVSLLSLGLPAWYLDRVVSALTLRFRSSSLCVGDRDCFLD